MVNENKVAYVHHEFCLNLEMFQHLPLDKSYHKAIRLHLESSLLKDTSDGVEIEWLSFELEYKLLQLFKVHSDFLKTTAKCSIHEGGLYQSNMELSFKIWIWNKKKLT